MNSASLALLTDLYQLTMAYGYWKLGAAEKQAVFQLSFRHNPFGGGFTIGCGLEAAIEYLNSQRFTEDDLAYLATLTGNDGQPLFESGFFDYLGKLRFSCDVHAIPEGTVVFPHEPLLRVTGPMLQCQILETPLLNLINFQTLIATKAARICLAAGGQPVLEFGLRRAQGIDGALTASRAAYIGGCTATSNVLAGKKFGIPIRGTHAHSWIMAMPSEQEAFDAYAEVMPNNCVFLVDTYDTLQGVRNAAQTGKKLRERGHEMTGIRLDSGDLNYLSVESRKILDQNGFPNAAIVASNDLDEHIIASLKQQGAAINVWGVGTRLVTGHDQPALGGVYKLSAIRQAGEPWEFKVKLSEQAIKISTPGILQVRRFENENGSFSEDVIYDEELGLPDAPLMIDPEDLTRRRKIKPGQRGTDLLVPVFRAGKCVYQSPPLPAVRERAQQQLQRFHGGVKRFVNPHRYPVGLEEKLHDRRLKLILKARGVA
ncbi:MAG TPA: nicotinate phosphoribosyltransferase [Planctomycetota bacterium]|jgi:nicotinate phosphoribosyltransferase